MKARLFQEPILRQLEPRKDSAIRRQSRCLPPRFERLLRGAACDNGHASGARDFSLPFPEGRASLRTLHRKHLPAPLRDNCLEYQRRVVGRAFHIHRLIAAARARPLSPPSARRILFLATNCAIPPPESTSGMAPPPANHPRKR